MMVYTKTPASKKKKKSKSLNSAKKLNKSIFAFRTRKPLEVKSYRVGATQALMLPSKMSNCDIASKPSIMDPMSLNKESESTRKEILAKSKRLAPIYSKGAVQYITEGEDIKTLGKKVR